MELEVCEAVGIEGTIITKCCNLSDQVEKEPKLASPPSQLSWLNRLSLFRPNSRIASAIPLAPDERGWTICFRNNPEPPPHADQAYLRSCSLVMRHSKYDFVEVPVEKSEQVPGKAATIRSDANG